MKRNIITDQNPPSAQEAPKEFSELLKEYNSLSGSGSGGNALWKLMGAAAVLAIIITTAVLVIPTQKTSTESTADLLTDTISPILEPLEYEYTTFHTAVSNAEETLIITPEGVIIEVPEGAFSSENNALTAKDIQLKLTHYDDAAAILMSQIPMHYDSAGTKFHFQSDGMFELKATYNGEPVELEKEVTVHYPQTTGRANSNNYLLVNNEWVFKGTSPLKSYETVCNETVYRFNNESNSSSNQAAVAAITKELETLTEGNTVLQKELESLKNNAPKEPRKQNLNNYRFYLDVNPTEFPELASFEEVLFEVKDSRFNFSMFDQTWNDINLKKSPRDGRYLVTLKSGLRVEIFDVYPVLTDKEFDEAFAHYSEELKTTREKQKSIENRIAKNEALEAQFLADLESQKLQERQVSKSRKVIGELFSDLAAETVYRSIRMPSLGVCNFDMGIPLPSKGMPVPAEFYVADQSAPIHTVSLIDIEENIYYSFVRAEFQDFRIFKGKQYILASVLPDGTLVTYRGDMASDEIKRNQPHRFKMELAPTTESSELKSYLGLAVPA